MTAGRRTLLDMSTSQKPVKWWQVAIGAALAAVVAFAVIWGVNTYRAAQAAEAEAVKQAEIAAAEQAEFDSLVVKFSSPAEVDVTKAPPPPPVVEEPVVEEPVYEEAPSGPVLCPPGTVAGAVDADGNESACYETNDSGQQCAAYDSANNCTHWYQP